MTTPERFRRSYESARANGYNGTRAEFAVLVLRCPEVFRPGLRESCRVWLNLPPEPKEETGFELVEGAEA